MNQSDICLYICLAVFFVISVYLFFKLLFSILFWLTHRRPLSPEQISKLAEARRCHYINQNFRFSSDRFNVNPKYRESLSKEGRWDRVSISYPVIATAIAEILRYKRHEWYVLVLSNEKESKFIWANKGDDNKSCYSKANIIQTILLAESNDCNTVMAFHNHPHTQDSYWNLLAPSETDIVSCNRFKQVFNEVGLNYIDGLVSQGNYIIYGYSFADSYHPAGSTIEEINKENNNNKKD